MSLDVVILWCMCLSTIMMLVWSATVSNWGVLSWASGLLVFAELVLETSGAWLSNAGSGLTWVWLCWVLLMITEFGEVRAFCDFKFLIGLGTFDGEIIWGLIWFAIWRVELDKSKLVPEAGLYRSLVLCAEVELLLSETWGNPPLFVWEFVEALVWSFSECTEILSDLSGEDSSAMLVSAADSSVLVSSVLSGLFRISPSTIWVELMIIRENTYM